MITYLAITVPTTKSERRGLPPNSAWRFEGNFKAKEAPGTVIGCALGEALRMNGASGGRAVHSRLLQVF